VDREEESTMGGFRSYVLGIDPPASSTADGGAPFDVLGGGDPADPIDRDEPVPLAAHLIGALGSAQPANDARDGRQRH
jgi:hypothetical protein